MALRRISPTSWANTDNGRFFPGSKTRGRVVGVGGAGADPDGAPPPPGVDVVVLAAMRNTTPSDFFELPLRLRLKVFMFLVGELG